MKNDTTEHKESLKIFIDVLEKDYYRWYELAEKRNTYVWYILQCLVLICGFLTSLFIAIFGDDPSVSWKIILIILPSVGSLSATILMQFKVQDLWKIREVGRVRFLELIFEGKSRLLNCKKEKDYVELLKYLQNKTVEIESQQGLSFFKTYDCKKDAENLSSVRILTKTLRRQ